MFDSIKFQELYLEPTRNGLTRPSKVRGKGIKMINMGEMFAHSRINNPPMELVQVNEKEFQNFSIQSGDLIFARQSLIAEGAGKCSIVINAPEPTVFESHLIRLRLNKSKADSTYYYYFFSSEVGRGMVQGMVMEVAASGIRGSDLAKLKVLHPPLSTQQRIASILSAYDDLIEVNNQRIKLLEETARELYKEWFVRMRFPGYKKAKFVKGVPKGIGEVKYFKDFIKLNRGFDLPEEKIKEGNYPVIASTSIKGYHSQFKVKGPIITTGRSGSLGTVLFVNQDGWPLNTSLYVKDFKSNEPLYVYYTLKLIDFESFNSGAGVPTLNQNHLHKLKMWVADEVLQTKFKKMVEPMFQQVEILSQQNIQLRQIRDRLLPRLISGKLEVKEKGSENG